MLPRANFGRERNKVKFNIWGFYLKGSGNKPHNTLTKLRAAASRHKARVPGRPNTALVLQKVSPTKVEVSWPLAVSADACTRVLKLALGENWRNLVTDPAGVQDAHKTAATAEEEALASQDSVAVGLEHEGEAAFVEALASIEAPSAGSCPLSAPPPSAGPSCSGTLASRAATVEACKSAHLLLLKLEVVTALYQKKKGGHHKDLQQVYTVNWAAELGRGTYGKVYMGTRGPATGSRGFAIKMLRDRDTEGKKTDWDAVWAAEDEVKRHVALGLHPNIVGLVDVGLFWEPPNRPGCNSRSAHIGLVCDMYEIDVRQFLKKSMFTQGGMRHVLNSVLEGLRFIHDRGCIHCDLKPANIFMRGAMHLRGCFSSEVSMLKQLGDGDALARCSHSRTEFQYQIPNSFEVRKGKCLTRAVQTQSGSQQIPL